MSMVEKKVNYTDVADFFFFTMDFSTTDRWSSKSISFFNMTEQHFELSQVFDHIYGQVRLPLRYT